MDTESDWGTFPLPSIGKQVKVKVTPLCPTLCDPMDCNPPGSSVHGILQSRILESVDIPFSRGSSWPRDWTRVSCVSFIGRRVLYYWCHLGSCKKCSICQQNTLTLQIAVWPTYRWEDSWTQLTDTDIPVVIQMDPDRSRHWFWPGLHLPGGRCKYSEWFWTHTQQWSLACSKQQLEERELNFQPELNPGHLGGNQESSLLNPRGQRIEYKSPALVLKGRIRQGDRRYRGK